MAVSKSLLHVSLPPQSDYPPLISLKPSTMASVPEFEGRFHFICEGELDLGSSCVNKSTIDILNLLFMIALCILYLVNSIRKHLVDGNRTRGWICLIVTACCVVTSVAYFGSGVWVLLKRNDGPVPWDGWSCLLRGLAWAILAVSLNVQRTKGERILILLWWLTFSVLLSALNVELLVKNHTLRVLDLASWPMNLLLLFCSIQLFRNLISQKTQDESSSKPLLAKEGENKTRHPKIDFINHVAFSWINPFLRLGNSKKLELSDIPPLESADEACLAYQTFTREWDVQRKQRKSTKNLVLGALANCYVKEMILVGLLALLRTVAVVLAPVFLFVFLKYSNSEKQDLKMGLFLVAWLVVIKVVESLSQRHWFFGARKYGMRMRSALMVAVFQKLLKLSSLGRRVHSTGEIVNYIAVDAYRLGEFPWWFHYAWTLPLQLVLSIGILFFTVGSGSLPGLIPLIGCALINVPFARMLQRCQSQFMRGQDERLRATSEVLNNMKIIKLQSWEEKFMNLIETLRDVEFKWLKESLITKTYGTVLYWMSPIFVSSVVFAGCALLKSAPLNAGTFFTVLATLRVMSEPVRMLPEALSALIQVKVSLDRLDVFLLDDELKEEDVKRLPAESSNFSVRIHEGVFGWNPEGTPPTLRCLNMYVSKGQKIAVCGPVGAGKSSLLNAVLGEIPKICGEVEVYGTIAYVSQTAWIQSGTIRDNILYGKPMDKKNYVKAIQVCALDKDIDNFDHGDLTEIGQRGLNLSGGQKQRLQLARAVYNDADIYLLDDPFSAVDAHTAAILFNECVMSALQNKTVILVTHQIEFLAEVDRILVMEAGQVTQSGNYEELQNAGAAFELLVTAHQDAMNVFENANSEIRSKTQNKNGEHMEVNGPPPTKENSQDEITVKSLSVQLTEDEEVEAGDVGWKPYIDYIRVSNGFLLLASMIISQALFVIFQAASTYWLAIAAQMSHINDGVLIGVYATISTISGVFVYLRSWFAALLGLKASKAFFSGFTDSVFKAPMLFFDSTPVGRILTRASSDMSVVDFDIPFSMAFSITAFIEVISTILIVATVTWQVLIVAVPVLFIARYVQGYYQASARELIRINGTTKAPVMNHASETSLGAVTIRAFDVVERFFQNNLKLIDTDATLFFHTNAAMEWVLVRVEALQNLTVFTATLLLVLLPKGTISPDFVGLSLSYSITLTATQVFLTRWHCSLDNYIVSVERIKQYMRIPPEPPAIVDGMRPPVSWPFEGRIDSWDLKIRYRPNAPLVLKGVTCTIKAGNKVGVVGRTGSGKTTLISALFRLVEPVAGKILIDDLDICSIGLKDLRMKLSIIPQEPALFRGSVRSNLDPLGLYSDHEIWKALEKCQLASTIRGLPNLLDSAVSDEGENWSAGQRQLFCLGRVLLKRNKILVLDEATASIDSATDAVLQRVIRQEFSSCTVITVAHRVPTVTDSDMVMVLSYGKLIEYDKPSKLMDTNSSFARLVAEYWANCRRNSSPNLRHF